MGGGEGGGPRPRAWSVSVSPSGREPPVGEEQRGRHTGERRAGAAGCAGTVAPAVEGDTVKRTGGRRAVCRMVRSVCSVM